ncbi:hypothetical protein PsSCT_28670 [Pseudomonas sp. SCT]
MASCFRYGFIVLAAVLYSVEVSASRTIIVTPSDIQKTYTPGSPGFAFSDSRNWEAPVSTQSGVKATVPVTYKRSFTFSKWAAGAKQLLKVNPGKAVATAGLGGVLAAVDWVMTDGTLTKPTTTTATSCYTAYYPGGISVPCSYGSATEACKALYTAANYQWWFQAGGTSGGACYSYDQAGNYRTSGVWKKYDTPPQPGGRVPVTDTDIDSLLGGIQDTSVASDSAPSILDSVPGSFDYPDSETFSGPASVDLPGSTTTNTDPSTGSTTVTEILPSIGVMPR